MIKHLFVLVFFTGCISGKKASDLSTLEKLNGENYKVAGGDVRVMGIPLNLEVQKRVKVEGKVVLGSGIEAVPVRNELVYLEKGQQFVAQTVSDQS